jgi:hypothetical protein
VADKGLVESWHQLCECMDAQADEVRLMIKATYQGIWYEKFLCCFGCGVPQAICRAWEENESRGWRRIDRSRCQYGSILIEGVVTMMI